MVLIVLVEFALAVFVRLQAARLVARMLVILPIFAYYAPALTASEPGMGLLLHRLAAARQGKHLPVLQANVLQMAVAAPTVKHSLALCKLQAAQENKHAPPVEPLQEGLVMITPMTVARVVATAVISARHYCPLILTIILIRLDAAAAVGHGQKHQSVANATARLRAGALIYSGVFKE